MHCLLFSSVLHCHWYAGTFIERMRNVRSKERVKNEAVLCTFKASMCFGKPESSSNGERRTQPPVADVTWRDGCVIGSVDSTGEGAQLPNDSGADRGEQRNTPLGRALSCTAGWVRLAGCAGELLPSCAWLQLLLHPQAASARRSTAFISWAAGRNLRARSQSHSCASWRGGGQVGGRGGPQRPNISARSKAPMQLTGWLLRPASHLPPSPC